MDTMQLIEKTRQELLDTSYLAPTLTMHMSDIVALIGLADLDCIRSIPEQQSILTHLGWAKGKEYRGQELKSVYFQASVWKSSIPKYWLIPGSDPQKQEYAVTSFWDSSQNPREFSYYLRVYRNSLNKVKKVEYPCHALPEMSCQLNIFMEGLLHSSMTFEETVKDMWDKKRAQFMKYPSKKQKELIDFMLKQKPHLESALRQEGFID
jgi:hypothetical protein